ncbi:peptidoglycan-binding protein [Streptomyces sp. NPDC002889]|uniref:peptidoglycan-binding domain-containing protein n=1 Tax=Streptomyces sp. NPDC002889 TaxID=3364669 RepID=UPI0036A00459
MEFDDTEPQRAHSPGPDLAQEIRDSFQLVLDALDAARADLYAVDEQQGRPESPPPSWQQPREPAGDAGFTRPGPSLSLFPAPPPPGGTEPLEPGPECRDPDPPHAVEPYGMEPLRTGDVRQVDAPEDVVGEPQRLRGPLLEPVPPPSVGTPWPLRKPPMASGAGPAYAAPPLIVPPPQEGARGRTGPRPYAERPAVPGLPAPASEDPPPPPPVHARAHARNRSRGWRRFTERRDTRLAGIFGLGAVSGLILASSLLVGDNNPAPAAPSAPSEQLGRPPLSEDPAPALPEIPGTGRPPLPEDPAPALPEIPGTGVLRQGDSGHGVYELQVRLLQLPNVYDRGAIDGRYDTEVRAAVARFQQRYGVSGDETGVYGDNTRHALMLRTK